jgi:hypothetical protein
VLVGWSRRDITIASGLQYVRSCTERRSSVCTVCTRGGGSGGAVAAREKEQEHTVLGYNVQLSTVQTATGRRLTDSRPALPAQLLHL